LLANAGPDKVGTHLKGPVTVLLVFVGYSEVRGEQEESAGVLEHRHGQTAVVVVVMRERL